MTVGTAAIATRIILLCHAATRAMREGRFPDAEDRADAIGLRAVAGVRVRPRSSDRVLCSPVAVAGQTVDALGWTAVVDDALRDVDFGDWAGRTLAEVDATDPVGLAGWLAQAEDPALQDRVAIWMDGQAVVGGRVIAVTHAAVVRVAIARALGITMPAAARIDLAPLTAVTLSFQRGWRLQAVVPAAVAE